jgi:hypothetical protein
MNKKITIIGGGLFGITIYILLKKKGINCHLFEKKNYLLSGASTNNLNRVHFGYHYPRDNLTAKQSYKGYFSFRNLYKKSLIDNFKNYYLIAKGSKVNLNEYLNFCKKNKLNFKILNLEELDFKLNKIEGGIQVKEPIYDWVSIKNEVKHLIKNFKENKIYLNEEVKIINKKKKYEIITNKNIHHSDIIIDASYDGSNSLIKKLKKPIKRKYQLVAVFEFKLKNFKKLGLALMDGKYFSFLPKGKCNYHLLYHVKHSVIKEKICSEFPSSWHKHNHYKSILKNSKKLILNDFKKYLPDLKIQLTDKIYLSPRVILNNVDKTDRRVSKINEISKNYYQIFSAKVDHSVDIGLQLLKKIKRN